MFAETDFINRFERASRAGFSAVEFMFPYEFEPRAIRDRLDRYALEMVLHNFPAGNWAGGERGIASLPERIGEFRQSVELALRYASALNCRRLNCMVGLTPGGGAAERLHSTLVDNLRFAAAALQEEGVRLMIEPINTFDMPGIFLSHSAHALELIKAVNHANLWLQYDVYHMQLMEGNLINTIRQNLGRIGHIQIADVPGRHEPGTGEINFANLFGFLDEAGYRGWIGCEYKPAGSTEEGLGWIEPYLKKV
jgi:hydroxypyruvate isomerase